jgi:hypothetical protein
MPFFIISWHKNARKHTRTHMKANTYKSSSSDSNRTRRSEFAVRGVSVRPPPTRPLTNTEPQSVIIVPGRLIVRWNAAMALFHLTLAALTLGVGNLDLAVPTYRTAIDFVYRNATNTAAGWDLLPIYEVCGKLYVTWLTASFFGISALFHGLHATLLRRRYLAALTQCRTPTRWIEYFFSAGLMQLLVAYTSGVRERTLLLAIAALTAVTMPYGHWVETVSRPKTPDAWTRPLHERILPWWLGVVPFAVAWIAIFVHVHDGALGDADQPPVFVYAIVWGEFALFASFGVVSLVTTHAPPRFFPRGEIAYQVLSLVSKGLLGGLLLANVLMQSRFEEAFEPPASAS